MADENINSGFSSKNNDLRNRILFTVLILSVYRLGTYVPLPGIDIQALQTIMDSSQKGLLGMFNIFSGGAVSRMAIFALGIMPYISSSIIIQLFVHNMRIRFFITMRKILLHDNNAEDFIS